MRDAIASIGRLDSLMRHLAPSASIVIGLALTLVWICAMGYGLYVIVLSAF
jgi:hypothetical protein